MKKQEAIEKIAAMRLRMEKELTTPDLVLGGLNITVTPQVKGWPDKKDRSRERSGRTELERHALYRRTPSMPYLRIQADLCLR